MKRLGQSVSAPRTAATLTAAACLLAVGACSDDDSGNGDDSGGSDSTEGFCGDLEKLADNFDLENLSGSDGEELMSELGALDPPAEIADDWGSMVEFLNYVVENGAAEGGPMTFDQWVDLTVELDDYTKDECGLTAFN